MHGQLWVFVDILWVFVALSHTHITYASARYETTLNLLDGSGKVPISDGVIGGSIPASKSSFYLTGKEIKIT
jgi:hypothetical protein